MAAPPPVGGGAAFWFGLDREVIHLWRTTGFKVIMKSVLGY